MDRWLYASRSVRGRPERLERVLRAAIPELVTGRDEPPRATDGSLLVSLPGRIAGLEMSKTVRVSSGVAYRRLDALRVPISWTAEPLRRAFPSLDGYLELEPSSGVGSQLTLVGRYRPPVGAMGAVADTIALSDVAQRTADVLVERICNGLVTRVDALGGDAPAVAVPGAANLRVRDVMSPDPVVFDPDMDLPTAARLLLHFRISGAPVVEENGELIGVLSESDLMAKEAGRPTRPEDRDTRRRRMALNVRRACTRPARTTHPDATLREAALHMLEHDVARLVVIDNSRVSGIVTRHDLLGSLVRGDAELAAHVAAAIEDVTGSSAEDGTSPSGSSSGWCASPGPCRRAL